MIYKVLFNEQIVKGDLKKLNKKNSTKIVAAIKNRLTIQPEQFTNNLHKIIKSHLKMSVENCKVVLYSVIKNIYKLAIFRLKKVYLTVLPT